ncbi:translation initiation factor IF-2 subunit beta [Candidatus Woesearchaeota archaeon]|nr:translation initiation factor IF-2 subunit beta [Candidatus Woesearchaeota archaeon]
MDYMKLLKKAREELPDSVLENERFKIPKVKGHIQGNKTVLSNFVQIANHLRRDPEHMLKYILKELATPGQIKKNNAIIRSKVSAKRINNRIDEYAEKFVLCQECGKPDTKINIKNRITRIKCTACGAKYPVNA